MPTLHRDLMNFEGPPDKLTELALQYNSWICDESAQRLNTIRGYSDGMTILTNRGLTQCMDSLIGIAHLNSLADLANQKHGGTVSALKSVTLGSLENDYAQALLLCRGLDHLVTEVFSQKAK